MFPHWRVSVRETIWSLLPFRAQQNQAYVTLLLLCSLVLELPSCRKSAVCFLGHRLSRVGQAVALVWRWQLSRAGCDPVVTTQQEVYLIQGKWLIYQAHVLCLNCILQTALSLGMLLCFFLSDSCIYFLVGSELRKGIKWWYLLTHTLNVKIPLGLSPARLWE